MFLNDRRPINGLLHRLRVSALHFLNAVLMAAQTDGGFGLDDVDRVEEAWEIADMT